MEEFLLVDNFEQIERESDQIQLLTTDLVEVLMNSSIYY